MNLFILDKDEKLIGTLSGDAEKSASHFFNAKKTKELNRGYQLTFEVDMSDEGISDLIKEEYFVVFKDNGKFRLVTIKEIVDIHADDFIKEVYCEDSSIELYDEIILKEMPSSSIELEDAMKHILSNTRWSVGEVDNVNRIKLDAEYKTKSVLEGLSLIARAYNVEVDFSVNFVGNNIVKRSVIMKRQLGRDLGKRIEYSKDMESIKRTTDSGDIKTAVIPFGKANEETGEMTTIADVIWTKEKNGLDKPFGQIFLEDPEATKSWGYKGSNGKKRPRWIAIQYNDVEDPNELIKYANMQLASHKDPKVTYEVEAVDLYKLLDDDDYSFETVQIGDALRIIDNAFEPPLAITSRVVKIEEYFSKTNTERKITLGNTIGSIVDKDTKTQVAELVSSLGSVNVDLSGIQAALDELNNKTGTGVWSQIYEINQILFGEATGFHYMSEGDGIWIYDKPLNMKPTKALALKGGSLGIAKWDEQKQRWDVGTFIDGNMVNASVINTGTLHADRIGAGSITAEKLEVKLKGKIDNSITQAEAETLLEVKAGEINTEISEKYSTKESVETSVNSAKQEAITTANKTTDTKLQSYPTSQVVNASIEVAKGDAVKESKDYTVNTLKNYSTTSEVTSAINQKASEITLGVASKYETKENVTTTITEAKGEVIKASKDYTDTKKNEAITSANNTLSSTIANYYTKSQTDSAIKVAKDEITLGVSNTYETKTNVETKVNNAVNNIEVGGRNLIKQTSDSLKEFTMSEWNCLPYIYNLSDIGLKAGDNVAFKLFLKFGNTVCGGSARITFYNSANTNIKSVFDRSFVKPNKEGYSEIVTTVPNDAVKILVGVQREAAGSGLATFKFHIKEAKLEKGTKCSSWTPAPEDTETLISSTKTEVKEYTDSQIKIAKDSITQSVASTYETKTEVESKVNDVKSSVTNLESRVNKAEQKITDSAIIQTVSQTIENAKTEAIDSANTNTADKLKDYSTTQQMNSAIQQKADSITQSIAQTYATKGEVSNTYASKSEVQQTVDNVAFKFNQSGGYNLLLNSRWENGWYNWSMPDSSIVRLQDANTGLYYCRASMVVGRNHGLVQAFKQEKGRTYTASAQVDIEAGAIAGLEISYTDASGTKRWLGVNSASNPSNYKNGILFFSWTPDVSGDVQVNFYSRGAHWSGAVAGKYLRWRWTQIEQGQTNTGWSPNPYEVYQGQTIIDKSGIRVSQSNVGTYTHMNANGFFVRKNDGHTLFEATNKVALYNGNGVSCVEIVNTPNANYGNARIDVRGGINFVHNPGQDVGINQILLGNDDRSDRYGFHNMFIRCWNSLGFQDNYGNTNMFFDVRRGRIIMKGALYQNTATPPRTYLLSADEDHPFYAGYGHSDMVDSILALDTTVKIDDNDDMTMVILSPADDNNLVATMIDDELHIDNASIIAGLVETVKALNEKIEVLQKEVSDLKNGSPTE